jgi:hypothetical protein
MRPAFLYAVRMNIRAFFQHQAVRKILRWTCWALAALFVLALVALLVLFRTAIYHRFITFPRQAAAWEALRDQRADVLKQHEWNEYRGNCHSHSELSHDSMVPFEEILRVMKENDRDFIMMSDHWVDGKADYSLQWRGMKDGVVFVPGFEMSQGFMPWRLPPETVIHSSDPIEEQARQIKEAGGLLFIAHPEQPDRPWHLEEIDGMEIYNIHADFQDEDLADFAPDILLNLRRWPDQTFRLIFDENTAVLANWDRLNKERDIVGIAANDCHQNVGVFAIWQGDGTLLLRQTDGKHDSEYRPGFLMRLFLRLFFGPLEPGRELFRVQLDPYERMTRYVSTHILAAELSEEALLEGLAEGRVFIGFDMIADSTGFTWMAESSRDRVVMGESIEKTPDLRLRALSPIPCRFTILNDGEILHQAEGREVVWQPSWHGKFRVRADLDINGEWTPWVYTNPITVN